MSGSYTNYEIKCFSNQIPFQLVTGMTRIHSTLHVFSKIILETHLWPLVLVRKCFFSFQISPFSLSKYAGARACIGRKYEFYTLPMEAFFKYHSFVFLLRFAETESIAVLAMLVSQYKITIEEEPRFAGETFEERKSRILSAQHGLTLT